MTRLLVVQPDDSDPPASLGAWLTAAGADLHVVRPFAEPLPNLATTNARSGSSTAAATTSPYGTPTPGTNATSATTSTAKTGPTPATNAGAAATSATATSATGATGDAKGDAAAGHQGAEAGYQGVVCLGGEMGAMDDHEHPWLKDVRQLLAYAVGARIPTLGVCLGGQLLAAATGGRVVKGDAGPEVGPGLVAKRDVAWTDPLFGYMPMVLDVMQFHVDAIDRLPPGAELMASAHTYPNQAFRLNGSAYGLQFHIETTTEIVQQWARTAGDAAVGVDLSTERLDAAHVDIAEAWQPFAERFVKLAAGELAMVDQARPTLPLV